MDPEKMRERAKLKTITLLHFHVQISSFPQAEPVLNSKRSPKDADFPAPYSELHFEQEKCQMQLAGLWFASLSSSALPFALRETQLWKAKRDLGAAQMV